MNKKLFWIIAILSLCHRPVYSQQKEYVKASGKAKEYAQKKHGKTWNSEMGPFKRSPLLVTNAPLSSQITYVVVREESIPIVESEISELLDSFFVDHGSWQNAAWHGNHYGKIRTTGKELRGEIIVLTSSQMNNKEDYPGNWDRLLRDQIAVISSYGDDPSAENLTGIVCVVRSKSPAPGITKIVREDADVETFRKLFRGIVPPSGGIRTLGDLQDDVRNLPDDKEPKTTLRIIASKLYASDNKSPSRCLAVIDRRESDGSATD